MKKHGIALAFLGLMFFILGFNMYLSHKISLTQNLVVGNAGFLISPLSKQYSMVYNGIIFLGFIMVITSYFLIIKEK